MADEQQQPQFPMTNFGILPDKSGGIVTVQFTPTLFLTQLVPEHVMDSFVAQWREAKKQKAQEQQVMQDMKATNVRDIRSILKA